MIESSPCGAMVKGKQEQESIGKYRCCFAALPLYCHFHLLYVVSYPTVNDDTLQHFMF